jgi:cytosine/adenosine deaminase-related metal-dependent hydrolase
VVRAATPANVDTVIIDGRIIKEGGRLLHVDPATVVRNAEESARRILKRSRESKP